MDFGFGIEDFKCAYVESPFAGDIEGNLTYLRAAMADCMARMEAPFANHGLYTQKGVLRDEIPAERYKGMTAGFAWGRRADFSAVYIDRGLSGGMLTGLNEAGEVDRPIQFRRLGRT